jgi:hypothetical protein
MTFGIVFVLAGVVLIAGSVMISKTLAKPNEAMGARPPSRLSFVLVGVGFIIVGIASIFGWA